MTTASTLWVPNNTLTITLAALAASAGLLAGQNGTAVDLTALTPVPIDVQIDGQIMTGATPTAGLIQVWAAASINGTNYSGGLAATNGAATLVAETKALLVQIAQIATNTTSNQAYNFSAAPLSKLFGGPVPKFNIFVTHSTVAALNATAGNHFINYRPFEYQSA